MDPGSEAQSTHLIDAEILKSADSESTDGEEPAESTDTIELARQTATNVRKRARLQGGNVRKRARRQSGVQQNAKVSWGHQFEHTVAQDHARVHYGDVYNLGSPTHECLALQRRSHKRVRFEDAQIQAVVVTVLILNILEGVLKYVLGAIPRRLAAEFQYLRTPLDELGKSI